MKYAGIVRHLRDQDDSYTSSRCVFEMCADSGAHIELSREPPPNTFEKIFIIKGSPQQIHHAQHLIRIKVWLWPVTVCSCDHVALFRFFHRFGEKGLNRRGQESVGRGREDANAAVATIDGAGNQQNDEGKAVCAQQYYGQQSQQNMTYPPGAYTMHYQQPGAQQQPLSQSAQFTSTPTVIPHTVLAENRRRDEGKAVCAQQYYGQQSQQNMTYPPGAYTMHYQQPGAQQQPLSQSAQFTTTPTVNPHTGQPDYSAQWAEYYRSIGMHDQATAIENHLRINAASATALRSFAQSVQPSQQIELPWFVD
ncbi:hypothetical protein Tcan_15951 [Toxocara canis]|uniref:Uncharacterized protein n=1 Tax=Toxocara canis TaxID=6265 RepID=A0A0B2UX88_TOXCA|nr:hypothetical protein Tcan_15951 [Toxocara canis]